ncbi:hypothetical protein [Microbacterium keratanolyticum]
MTDGMRVRVERGMVAAVMTVPMCRIAVTGMLMISAVMTPAP